MWVLFKHFLIEYTSRKMARKSPLQEHEKKQISVNKLERKSMSFFARELRRSRKVLRNCQKDPESYSTRNRLGRPPKNANAARNRLFREASEGQSSSRDLLKSQNLPITPRRARQLQHESTNLVYQIWKASPALTAEHKNIRLDWEKKKVTWTKEKWETVVFFAQLAGAVEYTDCFSADG